MSEARESTELSGIPHLRRVVVTFVLVALVPFLVPGLENFRAWIPGDPVPFSGLTDVRWSFQSNRNAGGIAAPSGVGGGSGSAEALEAELGMEVATSLGELEIPSAERAKLKGAEGMEPETLPPTQTPVKTGEGSISPADPEPKETPQEPVNPISLSEVDGVVVSLQDPTEKALTRFYTQLEKSLSGEEGAITRIAHYGDSTIAADDVTQTLRRNLQLRFGDAGHGFVVPARGTLPYGHRDVKRKEKGEWSVTTMTSGGLRSGKYGYGGMVDRGYPGASFRVGTVEDAPVGGAVSTLYIYAEGAPRGGEFKVRVDREKPQTFSSRGEANIQVHEVRVPDGPHEFKVSVSKGRVSLYGVALERDRAGVVYDSLGLVGAIGKKLLKWEDAHLAEAYTKRTPHLVVLQFGGNESAYSNFRASRYEEDLRAVLRKMKKAVPNADCLMLSPLDQGERKRGKIVTVQALKDIVEIQKSMATQEGCAFWNTYEAMGGEGAMGRWRKSGLASGDLRHASRKGYQLIGNLAYKALLKGFREHLEAE